MSELGVGVVEAGWMVTDYHIPAVDSHPQTRVVERAEIYYSGGRLPNV
jgi:hypothetical protein